MQTVIPAILLGTVLGLAVITDLKDRKIPNRLVLIGAMLALGWHSLGPAGRWSFEATEPGAVGLVGALLAFVAMTIVFLPIYALRLMGAGDVKLLAVAAAFFGVSAEAWIQLVGLALSVLAAGGLLALGRMAVAGNASAVFANVKMVLTGYAARAARLPGPTFDAATDSVDRMPYAIAIAVGTAFYAIGKSNNWLQIL